MPREVHALADSPGPLCESYDLLTVDLDGVVYVGSDAVPGAAVALRSARHSGAALTYVTNNASRTPHAVAEHLRSLGMPLSSDRDVVTSAQAAAHLVAKLVPAGSEVLVVGGEGLFAALEERGLRGTDKLTDATVAVVQGFHEDVGWRQLAEGAYAINSGLPWVATNVDLTLPTTRGIAPGNGSFVQALTNASGREPVVAGKPQAALFDEATERVGGTHLLVIGDRLDTDIEGANNIDADSLAVMTGITNLQQIAEAPRRLRPTFVAPNLDALLVAHPAVRRDGEGFVCGTARVSQADGRVTFGTPDAEPLHLMRAAITLAWEYHAETGRYVQIDHSGKIGP